MTDEELEKRVQNVANRVMALMVTGKDVSSLREELRGLLKQQADRKKAKGSSDGSSEG